MYNTARITNSKGVWWPAKETYAGELLEITLNEGAHLNEHMTWLPVSVLKWVS